MAMIDVIKVLNNSSATVGGVERKDPARALPQYWDEGTQTFDVAAYRADMEARGKDFWLPYRKEPQPSYNPDTHHAPVAMPRQILATEVVDDWNAPVAKTPAEIDAENDQWAGARLSDPVAKIVEKLLRVGFDQENRIRVLEGLGTVTAQQFTDAFVALNDIPENLRKQVIRALNGRS